MAQTFRPPATQRLYDVCVVGSQLGGVVAGALLARRGFRVLHVAHDDPGFHYVDHGYVLPVRPRRRPLPAPAPLGGGGPRRARARDRRRRARSRPSEPDLQLLLPRHRVDLSREAGAPPDRAPPRVAARGGAARGRRSRGSATLFDFAGFFLRAAPPLPPDGLVERRAVRKALKLAASAPGAPAEPVDEARPFERPRGPRARPEPRRRAPVPHLPRRRRLAALARPAPRRRAARDEPAAGRPRHAARDGAAPHRRVARRAARRPRRARARDRRSSSTAAASPAVRLADSPDAHVARAFVVATDAAPAPRRSCPPTSARGRGPARAPARARARGSSSP